MLLTGGPPSASFIDGHSIVMLAVAPASGRSRRPRWPALALLRQVEKDLQDHLDHWRSALRMHGEQRATWVLHLHLRPSNISETLRCPSIELRGGDFWCQRRPQARDSTGARGAEGLGWWARFKGRSSPCLRASRRAVRRASRAAPPLV